MEKRDNDTKPIVKKSSWLDASEVLSQTFSIREATLNDVREISAVHRNSRSTSFRGIIDQIYLDNLHTPQKEEERVKRRTDILSAGKSKDYVVVDEISGSIVWFVSWNDIREQEYLPVEWEIYALYLQEEYKSKWLGKMLFNQMASYFKWKGYHTFWLWSLTMNDKANGFYERMWGRKHWTRFYTIDWKEYEVGGYIFDVS